jgi:uncharacterized protein YjbI with pentapeptide repeats
MGLCKFEMNGYKCQFESLDNEDYCYWHIYELCSESPHRFMMYKSPTEEQIDNLRREKLFGAYLVYANLSNLRLSFCSFNESELVLAKMNDTRMSFPSFSDSNLSGIELKNANIDSANFSRAHLNNAHLNNALIGFSNFNSAYLNAANLRGANLFKSNLNAACLINTVFDSESVLDYATLINANIYNSYIDKTSSFRNATFFQYENLSEMEINEQIADKFGTRIYSLKNNNDLIFDAVKVKELLKEMNISEDIFIKLKSLGILKNINWGKNPTNAQSNPFVLFTSMPKRKYHGFNSEMISDVNVIHKVIFYKDILDAFKKNDINADDMKIFDNLIVAKSFFGFKLISPVNNNLLIEIDKKELYEVSQEVYSKLYRFYSNEGMKFRAKHAHYRGNEVVRKSLLVQNDWNSFSGVRDRIESHLFYFYFLKIHAGYADKIQNPIKMSAFWIMLFAILYRSFNGVDINPTREVSLLDYLYLSVTTFTGLGFANIQPDIAISGIQYLIMAESLIGVTMIAVIIFVITQQISR